MIADKSPFIKNDDEYTRDLNIISTAQQDAAKYISIEEGVPYEDALKWVIEKTTFDGELGVTDPATKTLDRCKKKGRYKAVTTFNAFLQHAQNTSLAIAPTLTCYTSPRKLKSLLSEYVIGNVKKRSKVKKEGQRDKAEGRTSLARLKQILQSTFKIKNNSVSGAGSSPHNPLYLKSSHPTLTSTCRSATSYSNGNVERFLSGNRHYRNADIALDNILSIINNSDYELIQQAMDAYGLVYPTAEDMLAVVTRSCSKYWKSKPLTVRLTSLIEKLTPIQRAAYLYSQDMHSLAHLNDRVVRGFLSTLTTKATTPLSMEESDEWMGKMCGDSKALLGMVCASELRGFTQWDIREKNPDGYRILGAHAKVIYTTISKFDLLIRAFWCTDHLPPSMAHFKSSIRESVIVSDTDSTIFTVQDWVKWYNDDELVFNEESNALAGVLIYLTSQTTAHVMSQLTANMGIVPERRGHLVMKNEFFFPVLALTTKAKHYYSYISACEGTMYDTLEAEYKGVSLKNSKIPSHIMKRFRSFTEGIMNTVMAGEQLSMVDLVNYVVTIENDITDSLYGGDMAYLPPYQAVKLSLDIHNPTLMRVWLDKIEDKDIQFRMKEWLAGKGKSNYKVALLPLEIVDRCGLPPELLLAKDIRKVCITLLEPFLLVLESVGIYAKNDTNSKLPSDLLPELAIIASDI